MALPRFVNKLSWSAIAISALWIVIFFMGAWLSGEWQHWLRTAEGNLGLLLITATPLSLSVFVRWIIT